MKIDFSKKGLVAYLTAGYPSMQFTLDAIQALQSAGASAIEVGIPYSDPVADGPIIALASHKALESGINLDIILSGLASIKDKIQIPLYFMSYYSPIFTYGEDRLIKASLDCGVSGIIFPDLQLDEGKDTFRKCKENGLDPILLLFPNASDQRIKDVTEHGGSFIYYVNLFGTTGVRDQIPPASLEHLRHIKATTSKPVFAGFGVSSRQMFLDLTAHADGVIIGSAIVKRILDNEKDEPKALQSISEFISLVTGRQ